jgi:DNA-nicking Smr family endonuclease
MLRGLDRDGALATLERFLAAKRRQGVLEIVVVVGRGRRSPGQRPVVAPAVRDWLEAHPAVVAGYEEAPAREGGAGALLVRLRPPAAGG